MSDPVLLAIIGVVSSLITGTLVVAVGVWADGRRKRAEGEAETRRQEAAAKVKADDKGMDELSKVRDEYREQIRELRGEIKELRDRLDAKERENRELSVTVARQDARITDLEETSEGLRAELTVCHSTHQRRTP